MQLKNDANQYGLVAKLLHWAMVVLLFGAVIAGNIIAGMPDDDQGKLALVGTHKSVGVLIMILLLIRIIWRLTQDQPQPVSFAADWQRKLAGGVHVGLYAVVFLQIAAGGMMSMAAGYPIGFFGLFEFPLLVGKDKAMAEFFHGMHGALWVVFALLVAVHVAGAVYHQVVLKDGVMSRMGFRKA